MYRPCHSVYHIVGRAMLTEAQPVIDALAAVVREVDSAAWELVAAVVREVDNAAWEQAAAVVLAADNAAWEQAASAVVLDIVAGRAA